MPNQALRTIRMGMRLSQEEFAARIRQAGADLEERNDCSQRTVQRWEDGTTAYPRRVYVRALERVTGQPIDELGFALTPRHGKLSDAMGQPIRLAADAREKGATMASLQGTLTGIWESRCVYHSSGRGRDFEDLAHLVLIHSGDEINVRSVDGSVTAGASITMQLHVRGHVVTGTWEEQTAHDSYYRGMTFHGAIQMQVEASGRRMRGMWVGFGRDFDVNTGPWELLLREPGTSRIGDYAHPPEPETRA